MNDSKKNGLYIKNVLEGGPADKAGVKSGDIIISINNEPILDWNDYLVIVKQGVPYDMEVLRDGTRILKIHVDTSNSNSELKSEADYAKIIAQIDRATGNKKIFDN